MEWFWDGVRWLESLSWVQWLQSLNLYEALAFSVGLFVLGVVGSLLFVSWVVVRLPTTYFCDKCPPAFWAEKHPLLRILGLVVKNLIGVILILIGIVLSLPGVPGQGILTILIGVMLVDFPGKRRLERWMVSWPIVLRGLNHLRARRGKPPLELDAHG
jgi:hypothetical protein